MNWSTIDWNAVGNGVLLLVLGMLTVIGKKEGSDTTPSTVKAPQGHISTAPLAEIAGALVDSGSLNRHTAAVEALTLAMTAGQHTNKEIVVALVQGLANFTAGVDRLTKQVEETKDELYNFKKELHEQFMFELVRGKKDRD